MPFDDVEPGLGLPIYGALGYEIFDRYSVEIDYAVGSMTLYDPATP